MEDKNEKHVSPNEISEGDVVQISTNEFFKVIRKISSNKIKGKKVTPNHDPDPEDERVIPVNNCKRCMSAKSFGQHKRFIPPDQGGAGTGFSKQGRKIKYPRSSLLDDKNMDKQARDYILGEISTEEFLNEGVGQVEVGVVYDELESSFRDILSPDVIDKVDNQKDRANAGISIKFSTYDDMEQFVGGVIVSEIIEIRESQGTDVKLKFRFTPSPDLVDPSIIEETLQPGDLQGFPRIVSSFVEQVEQELGVNLKF